MHETTEGGHGEAGQAAILLRDSAWASPFASTRDRQLGHLPGGSGGEGGQARQGRAAAQFQGAVSHLGRRACFYGTERGASAVMRVPDQVDGPRSGRSEGTASRRRGRAAVVPSVMERRAVAGVEDRGPLQGGEAVPSKWKRSWKLDAVEASDVAR